MSGKREIACGVDMHSKFILATILSSDGLKLQDRFETSLDDLLKFKSWLRENGCHKVALESTGNYWLSIYHVLEGSAILFWQMPIRSSIFLEERLIHWILSSLLKFV